MTDESVCTCSDSVYNDISVGMVESYGRELAPELGNAFIAEFRDVRWKNNERSVRKMQNVRSDGSCSTRGIPFGTEGDTDIDVLSPIASRSKSVFRKETSTYRTQCPPESDIEEPPQRTEILLRLMNGRMKTIETSRNEYGMFHVQ